MDHSSSYQERLQRVLAYIEDHLDEKLSLQELAKIAFFSPFHFHRIFLGMTGERVMSYVKRLKMERAAHALIRSKKSITHIAFEAGYESLEAFIRAFQKFCHCTPRQYRKYKQSDSARPQMIKTNNIRKVVMKVEIKQLPAMRIAYVRHTGPYKECKEAWGALINWAGTNGLLGPKTIYLGVCHDDPEVTEQSKIRYDASILLDKKIQGSGKIGIKTIESETYALSIHKGSYESLYETYAYICGTWAPKQEIEIYLNDPDNTPKEELITEVYVPIRKH